MKTRRSLRQNGVLVLQFLSTERNTFIPNLATTRFTSYTALLVLSTASLTLALAVNPQYKIPTTVKNITQGGQYSGYQCGGGAGAFDIVNRGGNISVADCKGILGGWNASHFNLDMRDWVNSTGDVDTFYKVVTRGSCQFVIRRADGVGGPVFIGDGDIKPLINGSIHRATFGNGTQLQTTEGNMTCATDWEPGALVERSLRHSGSYQLGSSWLLYGGGWVITSELPKRRGMS
ncbi:hypothetical protein VP1G_07855 [Cytospora mali]|uniref:Ecp2 effector protein-like domain-containing protein n=1 Tax=Cytospora mali TaxID=578113 RepID=A0A194V9X9_CYTMA|nr:hypothetical protein VP1G_07855 [Valsa mali var. pyri (nom. inval.)]